MVLRPRTLTRPKPLVSTVTPGVVRASADQRRLLIGIFFSSVESITEEKLGDTKFMIGSSALTSTTDSELPTTSFGVTRVACPT